MPPAWASRIRNGPAGGSGKSPAAPCTSTPFRPCPWATPAGTTAGPASPGAAWAWPPAGWAAPSPWPAASRESLLKAADGGREPDQLALAHLGEIDRTLTALTGYLARTAARIDAGDLSGAGAWSEALRVRGNSRHRRRTHPDAGQPEPRPRPRWPSTRSTESAWPTSPCTSASTTACATTPSSVPSRSRGTTHGELHAPGRRNRRGRLGGQRTGRAPGAAARRRRTRRPGVHRPGRAPGRRIPRRRRADGPAPAARRPRHGAAVHGGGGLPPGLTHHDAGTARRRPARGIRRRARRTCCRTRTGASSPCRTAGSPHTGPRCSPRCSRPSPT